MSVSACAVLSDEPLLSREKKLSWDQRETRPGVTQTGRERGWEGSEGGVRKGRKEILRWKGRKKMVEKRKGWLRMTGGVFYSCPGCFGWGISNMLAARSKLQPKANIPRQRRRNKKRGIETFGIFVLQCAIQKPDRGGKETAMQDDCECQGDYIKSEERQIIRLLSLL